MNRGVAYKDRFMVEKNPFHCESALSDFNKSIELDPNNFDAYYNRGNLQGKMGKYTEAILDHTRAIALNPKYTKAYLSRGYAYALQGKHEEAKEDWLKVVELDPSLKSMVKQLSEKFKLGLQLD